MTTNFLSSLVHGNFLRGATLTRCSGHRIRWRLAFRLLTNWRDQTQFFSLSQRCFWGFRSSGMWHCVAGLFSDVSKEHTALIIGRGDQEDVLELCVSYVEDEVGGKHTNFWSDKATKKRPVTRRGRSGPRVMVRSWEIELYIQQNLFCASILRSVDRLHPCHRLDNYWPWSYYIRIPVLLPVIVLLVVTALR